MWKSRRMDALRYKKESQSAHLAWGIIIAFGVMELDMLGGWRYIAALPAAAALGLAWEWAWYGLALLGRMRGDQPGVITMRPLGWPDLGPMTLAVILRATHSRPPGARSDGERKAITSMVNPPPKPYLMQIDVELYTHPAFDKDRPSIMDWLPFALGGVVATVVGYLMFLKGG